jgi:signal transduction histidine kinase
MEEPITSIDLTAIFQERPLKRSSLADPHADDAVSVRSLPVIFSNFERPIIVFDRSGKILLSSPLAERQMAALGVANRPEPNLFADLLQISPRTIEERIETGALESEAQFDCCSGACSAHVRWLPEADWLLVSLEVIEKELGARAANPPQHTVEALLQEREITYRNLLAAYLRLQEVNRQKTVFLASAAHELKTPLAVIKGYYDLLLTGSLGKLSDKQREILQESKDSCERLVRLVSMFLNYSTLESGKLVMHLRENELRDCLSELTTRWHEAFVRKQVRLESMIPSDLPIFKFDYQKVQQTVANLLDNALKHTPAGGHVLLRAELHFWERRSTNENQSRERRRERDQQPNSVKISVMDSGPGIASEHHQEIFEDFVRVDRSSSGMGLGLAIAKRLVQAHRGKIWVESEPRRGCTFIFLLPLGNT